MVSIGISFVTGVACVRVCQRGCVFKQLQLLHIHEQTGPTFMQIFYMIEWKQ